MKAIPLHTNGCQWHTYIFQHFFGYVGPQSAKLHLHKSSGVIILKFLVLRGVIRGHIYNIGPYQIVHL